jgi:transcriptional regulator
MFLPPVHADSSIPVLRQLIHDYPLGLLITSLPLETFPLIQASHIPFILDVQDDTSETELGHLRGHLARQNPQSKAIVELSSLDRATLDQEVLVVFTATPQHYVTPKFYTETKPTTGKVVPTWNYTAVQAYGRATVYSDATAEDSSRFLAKQIDDLSRHTETSIMDYTGKKDRPGPWKVSDAPERYIELMKKNIIGIEITITRLEGKFKMSQEMRNGDREGVIQGMKNLQSDVGQAVASLVKERGEIKENRK